MITARSGIVKAPPGRYQLVTILKDMVHRSKFHRTTTKANRKEYKRKKALAYYHGKKADMLARLEQIHNLPDDERELWLRAS